MRRKYSDTLARSICRRLSEGETLSAICRDGHMPSRRTVHDWVAQRDDFRRAYREARQRQLETWAEEILELADEQGAAADREALARLKLRIEVRQWLIARLATRTSEEEARRPRGQPTLLRVVTGIERPGDAGPAAVPTIPDDPITDRGE